MLQTFKRFFVYLFRDRTQTLQEYISSHNPQSQVHVEVLERQYYARAARNRMV